MKPRAEIRCRSSRARSSTESVCSAPASTFSGVSSSVVFPVATSNENSVCTGERAWARRKSTAEPSGVGVGFTGRPLPKRRVSA